MADESGDRGSGGGGFGGRDRGEGRDAPDFSGYGSEWGDPTTDFEHEIDLVNERSLISDLMSERLGERPGRFDFTRENMPEEKSLLDRARDRLRELLEEGAKKAPSLIGRAISFSGIPGMPAVGVASTIAQAIWDKNYNNMTDDQLNDKYGRAIVDMVTGGMFSTAELMGKGLQKAAIALGAKGNPDVSFGQDAARAGPSDRGIDVVDPADNQANAFAQSVSPGYKFSDGSTMIMNPKTTEAQQPKIVGLRQARQGQPIGDRREQIDELLRRARAGRIS